MLNFPMREAQFNAVMRMIREVPPEQAIAYMKNGNSRWIDIALSEGWSSTFRDMVQAWIRDYIREHGSPPKLSQIDEAWSTIGEREHTECRRSKSALNAIWIEEITAIRSARRLTPTTRRMTGEGEQ